MSENPQDVNKRSVANAQPGIGHNRPSLAQAVQANIETGVLLLCKEALITAIQDRRLKRPHLRVLAAIATHINTRTAKAWPSRMAIAIMADISPKSVSNVILELRGWGYLVADRETVEQADGKRLTVYTFGNIDHEGIRREIAAFVSKLRDQRGYDDCHDSSRPGGNYSVPPERERPATGGTSSSRQDGKFPPGRERSSRQDGGSNSYKEHIVAAAAAPVNLADLRERLMGVAGDALAHEAAAPGLLHIGVVTEWLKSGCDLELDIIPAVDARARAAIRAGKKIHSWAYFAQAVADAKAARTRPMPAGQSQPPQQRNWRDDIADKNRRMREAIAKLPSKG